MTTSIVSKDVYKDFFYTCRQPSIIVDPDRDCILAANHAALQLYGYSDEAELCAKSWSGLQVLKDRNASNISTLHYHRSGHKLSVHVQRSLAPTDSGALWMLQISPCETAAAELPPAGLELLQFVIDILPIPIYCKNSKAQYILCNQEFTQFAGKPKDGIIGKTSQDIMPAQYSAKYHMQDLALLEDCTKAQIPPQGEILLSAATQFFANNNPIEYEAEISLPGRKKQDVVIRKTTFTDNYGRVGLLGVITDISDYREQDRELLLGYTALDWASEAIIATDAAGHAIYLNKAFSQLFGYELEQLKNDNTLRHLFGKILSGQDFATLETGYWQRIELEGVMKDLNGKNLPVHLRLIPVIAESNHYAGIMAIVTDNSENVTLPLSTDQWDANSCQNHKLEAIGQLTAGIAHELNTPIQFVGDNINFLDSMFKELLPLVEDCAQLTEMAARNNAQISEQDFATLKKLVDDADVQYIAKEIPTAFEQLHDGVKRIADIVRAMKDFAHPGTGIRKEVDINKAITNTVTIARNEWKYVSDVKLELDAGLPLPPCYEGELKQVILNLLINAAHAIGDKQKQSGNTAKGIIAISTHADDKWVYIDISDTGNGIPDSVREKIYDPFFTTKEPGRGTGQGLTISREVIIGQHQGKLFFDTAVGQGTTFHIWLPLKPLDQTADASA